MKKFLLFILIVLFILENNLYSQSNLFQIEKKINYYVAILNFESKTPEISKEQTDILTNSFINAFQKRKRYKIMTRTQMREILDEQMLQKSEHCSESGCAIEVGKILGVGKIIVGQVGKIGETFAIILHLINVETSEEINTCERRFSGKIDKFFDIIPEMADEITGLYQMQITPTPSLTPTPIITNTPSPTPSPSPTPYFPPIQTQVAEPILIDTDLNKQQIKSLIIEDFGNIIDCAVDAKRKRVFATAGENGTYIYDIINGALKHIWTIQIEDVVGYHNTIKIVGDYCLIADARRFIKIYRIDIIPPTPIFISKDDLRCMRIEVAGDIIYATLADQGFRVCRFIPPSSLVTLTQIPSSGEMWDVWVENKYAYLANRNDGLYIYDVTLPQSPKRIKVIPMKFVGTMGKLVLGYKNFLFAGCDDGILIFDKSNNINPSPLGVIKLPSKGVPKGMYIENNLLYIGCGSNIDNGLLIADISKIQKPEIIGKITFNALLGTVDKYNNYIYIANHTRGVRCIDASNPKNPSLIWLSSFLRCNPIISDEEKKILDEINIISEKIKAGQNYNDLSTPGRAFLTMISAITKNNFDLFKEANPQGADYLASSGNNLSSTQWLTKTKVHRIIPGVENREGNVSAVFIGHEIIMEQLFFVFCEGKWRKVSIPVKGSKLDDSYLDYYEKSYMITKEILTNKACQELRKNIINLPYTNAGEEALKLFKQAIDLNTLNENTWLKLGLVLVDLRKYEEAMLSFQMITKISCNIGMNAFVALVWQGHLSDLWGKRSEAIKFYHQAISIYDGYTIRHDQFKIKIDRTWLDMRLQTPFTFR